MKKFEHFTNKMNIIGSALTTCENEISKKNRTPGIF